MCQQHHSSKWTSSQPAAEKLDCHYFYLKFSLESHLPAGWQTAILIPTRAIISCSQCDILKNKSLQMASHSIIMEKSAKPGVTVNILSALLTTACMCIQKQNKGTASHCSRRCLVPKAWNGVSEGRSSICKSTNTENGKQEERKLNELSLKQRNFFLLVIKAKAPNLLERKQ